MPVPRVFHSQLTVGGAILSAEESHHVAKVLRCGVGESLLLFDGQGRESAATVTAVGRRDVEVAVGEIVERPETPGVRLTLAVALPRRQRQPFLFEKLTELGVWSIWPTVFERSVVRPKNDAVAKWRRATIEAAKQCGRARLPNIEEPSDFAATVERAAEFDLTVVTDAGSDAPSLLEVIGDVRLERLLLWIGPEGGLTDDELEVATRTGARSASLGEHTLRVETAALAAAAIVSQSSETGRV